MGVGEGVGGVGVSLGPPTGMRGGSCLRGTREGEGGAAGEFGKGLSDDRHFICLPVVVALSPPSHCKPALLPLTLALSYTQLPPTYPAVPLFQPHSPSSYPLSPAPGLSPHFMDDDLLLLNATPPTRPPPSPPPSYSGLPPPPHFMMTDDDLLPPPICGTRKEE